MPIYLIPLMLLMVSACDGLGVVDGVPVGQSGEQQVASSQSFPLSGLAASQYEDAYAYLNSLRRTANMVVLHRDHQLEIAALNHGQYLLTNNTFGHDESPGLPGFTGEGAAERAVAAGYRSLRVSEGISHGRDGFESIDNLMSAIYHRFTLLDERNDSIGMSYQQSGDQQGLLVHNMGNAGINEACTIPVVRGSYYTALCSPDIRVSASAVRQALDDVAMANPAVVLWPPQDATDIPPVFFEEMPDPLPDYSVSGYPVSVQFNALKNDAVSLLDFRLYDTVEMAYVDVTRTLQNDNDPNAIMSERDFVLFPLQRLEWGRKYRVEFEYSQNAQVKTLEWSFTTRELQGDLVRIDALSNEAIIADNRVNYVYVVPQHGDDYINSFRSYFSRSVAMSSGYIDGNTLVVTADGERGDIIRLVLNDTRTITLTIQ